MGIALITNNILTDSGTAVAGLVPTSRTISTTAPLTGGGDLSANRTIAIPAATTTVDGYLSAVDWTTFNGKQAAGDYITSLTGEATAVGPGAAAVTLNNASVTGKVLTGVNITGGTVLATDTMLTAFGKLQNQINGLIGSTIYQGVWNANTNTPTLASGVGTNGYYYIVNVAGATNLDGITDWKIGDWAIFNGGVWQKVDNTESVTSVNGFTGAVSLTTDNVGEGTTNLYFSNARARSAVSLTTTGTSGAATYNNTTGVFNIPNYSTDLTGYVPYTGATANVDLGTHTLIAAKGTFSSSGSANTVGITHSSGSGIALNITKGGNGEGIYVNKTSGSGNAVTIVGTLNATTLVRNGGTAAQFLKADGSIDSSTYLTTASAASTYLPLTGGTLTGALGGTTASFSGAVSTNAPSGGATGEGLVVGQSFKIDGSGTSQRAIMYVVSNVLSDTYGSGLQIQGANFADDKGFGFNLNTTGGFEIYVKNTSYNKALTIANTNAATFTNTVTATSLIKSGGTSAQFLKADGSVDSTAYGTGTVTSVAALTLGTTGTDLSSSVATGTTTPVITLNVPTASATNRGALSAADWTTFNSKQNALTNPITGTGTTNRIPKFTGASTLGNSIITELNNAITVSGAAVDNAVATFINTDTSSHGIYVKADGFGFKCEPTSMVGGITLNSDGSASFSGDITANKYTKIGGTASQFLMADGSVSTGPAGGITGSGTTNYVPKFTGASTIGNSNLQTDASGNLGLGITPSAWDTVTPVIQIGTASFYGYGTDARISANFFYQGADKYILNGFATTYVQQAGQHIWLNAPSGTAGANITFAQAMTLTPAGNLGIGTASPSTYSVAPNLVVDSRANSGGITIKTGTTASTSNYGFLGFADGTTGTEQYRGFIQYSHNFNTVVDAMQFGTSGTEAMRITSGGNVGIGTTSPTDRLDISGVLRVVMPSDPLTGAVTAKILSFAPNPFGLVFRGYETGTHSIQSQRENNNAQLYGLSLQPSGGNVMIGTTTDAGFRLDVSGTGRFSGALTGTSSSFSSTITSTNERGFRSSDAVNGGSSWLFGANTGRYFISVNGGVNALIIENTGAATFSSSVTATSFVSDGASSEGLIRIERDTVGTNAVIGSLIFTNNNGATTYGKVFGGRNSAGDGYVALGTGVSNNLYALESGNVGIGTTAPGTKLDILGTGVITSKIKTSSIDGVALFNAFNDANETNELGTWGSSRGGFGAIQPNNGYIFASNGLAIGSATDVKFGSGASNSLRMQIFSSGNVFIGSSPSDAGFRLDVNGTGRFQNTTTIYKTRIASFTTQTPNQLYLQSEGYTGSGFNTIDFGSVSYGVPLARIGVEITGSGTNMRFGTSNSYATGITNTALTIDFTGGATFSSSVTATSFFESSDKTIKTLIEDNYQAKGIESVVAKLYTKNGKEELGYFAQDLQGILPSAVSTGTDGLLSLSYREVHTAKIARLEKELEELKAKLN